MAQYEFHERNVERWDAAMKACSGPTPPDLASWTKIGDMSQKLAFFMGSNFGHTHLPRGGGLDYKSVRTSQEAGFLEFETGNRSFDIVKPKIMTIAYFRERPRESFIFIELFEISTVLNDERDLEYGSEELVHLDGQNYRDRSIWDDGILGFDDQDREIPLPQNARLVTRWLRGNLLIVAKGSMWNGDSSTYDGRHTKMSAVEIRDVITKAIARRSA